MSSLEDEGRETHPISNPPEIREVGDSSFSSGCLEGLGLGILLVLALVVLFSIALGLHFSKRPFAITVWGGIALIFGYLFLVGRAAKKAPPEALKYRTGIWVAACVVAGALLLNPLSLCFIAVTCN